MNNREELVNELAHFMRRKLALVEKATTYRIYIENLKKEIKSKGYSLDKDKVYEPTMPEQIAYANLLFYKNGIKQTASENVYVRKRIKELANQINDIDNGDK